MAIDLVTFRHLLRISGELTSGKRALVLGRQNFLEQNPPPRMARQMPVYQAMLTEAGHDRAVEDLIDEDGYCDSLFDYLGFGATDYMDLSDYEGANVLHDLNQPVPEHLHGAYDFILDGGTVEHIFNVPQALTNLDRMLSDMGRLLALNPANNWLGHGFYQFSPELVWSFWRDMLGYRVNLCAINAMRDWYGRQAIDAPPPEARSGARDHSLRKLPGTGIFLLVYDVTKDATAPRIGLIQQSDYSTTWSEAEAGRPAPPP